MPPSTILTDTLRDELCTHIASPAPVRHACAMVGIGESTFHDWMGRGAKGEQPFAAFSEAVARARGEAQDKLKAVILRAATGYTVTKVSGSGKAIDTTEFDWKAAAWLAERMFPDDYGNRQKLEHSVERREERPVKFDEATEAAARAFLARATDYDPVEDE